VDPNQDKRLQAMGRNQCNPVTPRSRASRNTVRRRSRNRASRNTVRRHNNLSQATLRQPTVSNPTGLPVVRPLGIHSKAGRRRVIRRRAVMHRQGATARLHLGLVGLRVTRWCRARAPMHPMASIP